MSDATIDTTRSWGAFTNDTWIVRAVDDADHGSLTEPQYGGYLLNGVEVLFVDVLFHCGHLHGVAASAVEATGENHFTVIAPLADPQSQLTQQLVRLAAP